MAGTPLKLIVGLGNPDAGVLAHASQRWASGLWMSWRGSMGGSFRRESKHQGELARVRIAGEEVTLLKPHDLHESQRWAYAQCRCVLQDRRWRRFWWRTTSWISSRAS